MQKKKVLFINDYIPFPPTSGGSIILCRILKVLSEGFEVHGLLLGKSKFREQFISNYPYFTQWETVFLRRRDFTLKNHLLSFFNGLPLIAYCASSDEMKGKIKESLRRFSYDMIVLTRATTLQYFPENFHGMKILNLQDTEDVLWKHLSCMEKNPIKKILYDVEHKRLQSHEKQFCGRFDRIALISEKDKQHLSGLGVAQEKIHVYSGFADEEMISAPEVDFQRAEKNILFVGSLNWFPNSDAVKYFIKKVFPMIKHRVKIAQFIVAGYGAEQKLLKLQKDGIQFTGFVENLEEVYKRSSVFVVPLRMGSGLRLKILNALARGIPVVTTQVGCEGIQVKEDEHLLIAQNDEDFAEKVICLLDDASLCRRLSQAGRLLIQEKYLPEHFDASARKIFCDA